MKIPIDFITPGTWATCQKEPKRVLPHDLPCGSTHNPVDPAGILQAVTVVGGRDAVPHLEVAGLPQPLGEGAEERAAGPPPTMPINNFLREKKRNHWGEQTTTFNDNVP